MEARACHCLSRVVHERGKVWKGGGVGGEPQKMSTHYFIFICGFKDEIWNKNMNLFSLILMSTSYTI